MIPTCITAFFNGVAAYFTWRAKTIEWGHNNEIYANRETMAALAVLGDDASLLRYDRLAKHVRRQCELLGIEGPAENHPAAPRAIPVPGGDADP
jgi:hypothetical protein